MTGNTTMKLACACLVLVIVLLSGASYAADQAGQPRPTGARAFATPQAAAEALIEAAAKGDVSALLGILGSDSKEIISTQDPVQDKNNTAAFVADARKAMSLDASTPNRAILLVGPQEWPLPIPIVERGGKWYFDAKAGHDEIVYRRIGANELDAIQICRGYVEAQREYASEIHDESGVNQYARRLISTPGKRDGLYWKNADGTPGGPISEVVAKALAEGYSADKQSAYHGYHFKVLKGQGPAAPLGKINYVIEDVMIGGFALLAAPAEYRVTGVKTFMVSNDGVVYQKDLGPDTVELAKKIELYNPDKTWQPTDDEWTRQEADQSDR
jgi:hypothetical protein